jgi:hypothetical protein
LELGDRVTNQVANILIANRSGEAAGSPKFACSVGSNHLQAFETRHRPRSISDNVAAQSLAVGNLGFSAIIGGSESGIVAPIFTLDQSDGVWGRIIGGALDEGFRSWGWRSICAGKEEGKADDVEILELHFDGTLVLNVVEEVVGES